MYYEFFGLREAPFKFLPSDTLFLSAAHLEGLAALEWAFNEPSGLTLLVGEVGTGKTMLIHSLIARMKDERIRIAQISNPTMNFEEMLGVILQQLRINPGSRGKLAALQALKTFVSDPTSSDRVILIFDEAQGLSDQTLEEIRLLSNSRPPQRHALQMILVGQPELVERLNDPKMRALNQRIGARAVLRPLRGAEVRDYINCLLRAQGAERELFEPSATELLTRLSGGLPRKINNLCHNALFHAYVDRSPSVQVRHLRAASSELENLLELDEPELPARAGPQGLKRWTADRRKPLMFGSILTAGAVAAALVMRTGPVRKEDAALPVHQSAVEAPGGLQQQVNPQQQVKDGPQPRSAAAPAPAVAMAAPDEAARRPPLPDAPPRQAGLSYEPPSKPMRSSVAMSITRSSPPPVAAPDAPSGTRALSPAQERRLRYEVRRAENSFEDGRYRNSIYHSRRALQIQPDNQQIRDLLQRAQAAVSPGRSASVTASRAAAPGPSASVPQSSAPVTQAAAAPPDGSGKPFAGVVREEIRDGDAYMRAGNYDMALRKFLTAAVLDPDNDQLPERISRARAGKEVMGGDGKSVSQTAPTDGDGAR